MDDWQDGEDEAGAALWDEVLERGFRAHAPSTNAVAPGFIGRILALSYKEALRAHPGVSLAPDRFAERLARLYEETRSTDEERYELPLADEPSLEEDPGAGAPSDEDELLEFLVERQVPDLLWSWACLEEDRSALVQLDGALTKTATTIMGKKLQEADRKDILQSVRARLLLGGERSGPALDGYRGTGPLDAWLATVTRSALLTWIRDQGHPTESLDLEAAGAPEPTRTPRDPEALVAIEQLVIRVRSATYRAIEKLPAADRALLKLHTLDQMTDDQLATMLDLHRTSVVKRRKKICRDLFGVVVDLLAEELRMSRDSIERLFGATLLGRLQLTLERVLRDPDGGGSTPPRPRRHRRRRPR